MRCKYDSMPLLQIDHACIHLQFHLVKKDEKRWNFLLKDKKLYKSQINADWDKWIDEDEEDGKGFALGIVIIGFVNSLHVGFVL